MPTVRSFRDLTVWQRAMELAREVYMISEGIPKQEQFRLTSQLLKAATSVPANIAEGHARGTRKDYAHFVTIARGSLAETETLLELATQVGLVKPEAIARAQQLAIEVGRMPNALLGKLRLPPNDTRSPET